MTNRIIIVISLFFIFYNIGGLATTNILRLTKGNTLTIHSSKCICDNCGSKIPPLLQFPIISYIVCRGHCRNCGCKIPVYPLILEITIFLGMSLVTALFRFSVIGILLSFLFYEIVRNIVILLRGKRETQFRKQYVISIISMCQFLIPCLFISFLYSIA